MMTDRRPPVNIVVPEEKQRVRFGLDTLTNNSKAYASARSFASSITFSEIDGTEHDEFDPFFEASFSQLNDRQPGMPQRRRSASIASINEENLKKAAAAASANHADAAPAMPSRQKSEASGGTASQKGAFNPRASDNSSSSAEPLPDYLQPAFCAEYESKMKELSYKAEIFKRIVDIKDRKYGIRTFKQCFIGSEAVDRMLEADLATTREEAVELGRSWMKFLGLFSHVVDQHAFKDKYLFYRFSSEQSDESTEGKRSSFGRKSKNSSSSMRKIPSDAWYTSHQQQQRDATIREDEPMA